MYLVMLEIEVWLVDGVDKIVGLEIGAKNISPLTFASVPQPTNTTLSTTQLDQCISP